MKMVFVQLGRMNYVSWNIAGAHVDDSALGNSLEPSKEYEIKYPSAAQFGRRRGMPFENGILHILVA